jgi:thiamine-phosphate diphosphorylase
LSSDPVEAKKLLLDRIERAALAGVDWIQLREKDLSGRELAELAADARQRAGSGCALFVNDRLDVALANGAAGVHLGESSLPAAEAKRLARERRAGASFVVGASVHALGAAREAETAGSDYLIFGPVFSTPSKESFGAPQGLGKLREVCERVSIPVIAIGGISVENAGACLQAGARGIAAIRLFQDAMDLKAVLAHLHDEPT